MVRGLRVGDAETHRHTVQKSDPWRRTAFSGKVIPNAEDQFVLTCLHLLGNQQRLIGAAVGVSLYGFEQPGLGVRQRPEFDPEALSGAAVGGVQDVCGQFGGHGLFIL
jgi:hypothetical protein